MYGQVGGVIQGVAATVPEPIQFTFWVVITSLGIIMFNTKY